MLTGFDPSRYRPATADDGKANAPPSRDGTTGCIDDLHADRSVEEITRESPLRRAPDDHDGQRCGGRRRAGARRSVRRVLAARNEDGGDDQKGARQRYVEGSHRPAPEGRNSLV